MPLPSTARRRLILLTQVLIGAPAATFAGLALWTRNCSFEPFGPETDPLFKHPILQEVNPRNNPSTHDCCLRRVPFERLRPELLEDAKRGGSALVEEFARGMWGGFGYAVQRRVMGLLTRGPEKHASLWSPEELRQSKYEPGTIVTNYFLVLDKTPTTITLRGCPAPTPIRPHAMDNLSALTAELDEGRKEAEFRLKALAFDGVTTRPREDPFGGFPGVLHRLYARVLVETAVGRCVR
ncbi:hypothetical protein BBK36DRAFT_1119379 [Trichoderma citrinoviride]|uniref:Uncharacterized protein n=1 Tax=Trichoderma citrinoviride TaxID=58853 RepID=A0A2T4BA21_9HYPO|nr:hypothetical protein BBK36DRAFT_1119379 [Trichoderma citrinoviride]PTB66164.1 hypothetical protein BBK36DRAFT_1119379 [Trichoderma citrinoviride]